MSAAWKAGVPCGIEEAIEAAALLLAAARLPLVYGLVQSTVEAQREAVRLARLLRGVLDSASSGPADHLAFARLGRRSASLGELRRRAELVLFWGCDPDVSHAGFVERYAPAHEGRTRLAIDVGDARGPACADLRVAVPGEREIEALLVLRAFVRGRRVEREIAAPLGVPIDALRELASRLKACRHAALFYEADPPPAHRDPERAASLTSLSLAARPGTSVRLLAVRESGNPMGADSVLAWLTGCPAAVCFAQGTPRFGPRQWSAEAVLTAGDVDAALLVGVGSPRHLSARALDRLGRLPTVWIGSEGGMSASATVAIAAAPLAATPGHVFRMDGVALCPLAPAPDPGGLPTEASVLARIAAALPRPHAERRA